MVKFVPAPPAMPTLHAVLWPPWYAVLIAALLATAIVTFCVWKCCRRCHKKRRAPEPSFFPSIDRSADAGGGISDDAKRKLDTLVQRRRDFRPH